MASEDKLECAACKLLAATGRADAVFRYTVSAGSAGHCLPSEPYREPWDMLSIRDLPPPPPVQGVVLKALKTARDSGEVSPRGKSLAYLNSLYGWREQRTWGEPWTQGLMLTPDGMISEGVTCNIFWIQNGKFFTPSVETGLLLGVHRAHLIELAGSMGIEVIEGAWPADALCKAEAVGTINAATGPVSVREVQDAGGSTIWQRKAVASESFLQLTKAYTASLPV